MLELAFDLFYLDYKNELISQRRVEIILKILKDIQKENTKKEHAFWRVPTFIKI